MLRRIFGSRNRKLRDTAPSGRVPEGQRIYAIGDIHGRLDLLDDLLERIETDDRARPSARTTLIFLGDLVDRGPQSAQVVDRLMALSDSRDDVRFILGNHEEVMLKAIADEKKALPFFLRIGGAETVMSYGIDADAYHAADYGEVLTMMRAAVPQAHVDFLAGFEDMIVIGDYAFVHAGVKPQVPLAEQNADALRWIRGEFLEHEAPLEKIVVHGHTITDDVETRICRIGIDTGAYATGRLTAMGFEGAERWVLQTTDRSDESGQTDCAT